MSFPKNLGTTNFLCLAHENDYPGREKRHQPVIPLVCSHFTEALSRVVITIRSEIIGLDV